MTFVAHMWPFHWWVTPFVKLHIFGDIENGPDMQGRFTRTLGHDKRPKIVKNGLNKPKIWQIPVKVAILTPQNLKPHLLICIHSSSPELSLEITHNLVQTQGNILKNVIFAPFSNFVQNLGDKYFPYLPHSLRYVSTA